MRGANCESYDVVAMTGTHRAICEICVICGYLAAGALPAALS
jgi:hypothetical protein